MLLAALPRGRVRPYGAAHPYKPQTSQHYDMHADALHGPSNLSAGIYVKAGPGQYTAAGDCR
jgi:hypothetical protein